MFNCEILVNKSHRLPISFVPENLVQIPGTKEFISKIVYEKFLQLQEQAKQEGINIFIDNAYRTWLTQAKMWKYFAGKIGFEATMRRVAVPGYSEHQTGLAMDLGVMKNNEVAKITDVEVQFLENNAYKYGFILRYPKGKEDITGYQYEPWHIRYVGEDLALYLKENDLTLEEYYLEKRKIERENVK